MMPLLMQEVYPFRSSRRQVGSNPVFSPLSSLPAIQAQPRTRANHCRGQVAAPVVGVGGGVIASQTMMHNHAQPVGV
jgi:hypothetical protein